ncbi:MAG: hypothetical protein KDA60_15465, partial [Planctomycetales bacterium]|nr:hypothetical protein [Planctomycetales bacterium]
AAKPGKYFTGEVVVEDKKEVTITKITSDGTEDVENAYVRIEAAKSSMESCFATCQSQCSVQLELRSRFVRAEYEEDDGYRFKVESAIPTNADDSVATCVGDRITSVITGEKLRGRWDLTLSVGM